MHPHHQRLLDAASDVGGVDLVPWAAGLLRGRGPSPRGAGLTLDASFYLSGDGREVARCSVNDRGCPEAFRVAAGELVEAIHPDRRDVATKFWDRCPPGRAQTTVGLKATPSGTRLSLYFEELSMLVDGGRALRDAVGGAFDAPNDAPGEPVAVALDLAEVVTFKEYRAVIDRPGRPGAPALPGSLEAWRRALPFRRGSRRMLWATRHRNGLRGRKVLWVPEARHDPTDDVWATTRSLLERLRLPPSRARRALWELADEPALYPDLVSLDTDASGVPTGATVYVAVRPR